MKNKIKFSIIIPSYNVEKYIIDCVQSVLNQKFNNYEIVIVNDGSTDNTDKIVKDIISTNSDKKIIYLQQENSGSFAARMAGINKANGEYIFFIDADDWIEENTLEKLNNYLIKYNNPDIIKFRTIEYPSLKKSYYIYDHLKMCENMPEIYELLVSSDKMNMLTNEIVHRKLFDGLKCEKKLVQGEDSFINFHLIFNAKRVLFIPDVYYYYRKNANSITRLLNLDKIISHVNDVLFGYDYKINKIKSSNCCIDNLYEKLGNNFLNYFVREVVKIYKIPNLKQNDYVNFFSIFESNDTYNLLLNSIELKSIKSENILHYIIKRKIVKRDYCGLIKYKLLIRLVYLIKELYEK